MHDEARDEPNERRSWRGLTVTVIIIVAAITLMILNSPQRFDMDLDKIGAGQPALVLIYDGNLVVTAEQAHELNKVREDFANDIAFLVADVSFERSQQLMRTHAAGPAAMLLFTGDGRLIKKMQGLLNADQLRAEITSAQVN